MCAPKKWQTLRFTGYIGTQEVLILLDSRSVGTFVSAELAEQTLQPKEYCSELRYSAADGSPMISNGRIPDIKWIIQGHSFHHDAIVLPLKGFDMILGSDWLEDHNPMWIHWRKKKLRIPHEGIQITLNGVKDTIDKCSRIPAHKLKGLLVF